MGKINELAISDSNVNMNIVEKYGTFRLQSDKQITENGKHTADVGFNGLSSVNVNVSGSAELEDNKTVSITENGVVEITPSAGKDGMKKVTATVNVSGGGADLEDNKEATINVSTYTEPIEITPTAGKDGMKKATVTLSNIPSGGSATAYAWIIVSAGRQSKAYLNIDISPSVASTDDIKMLKGSVTDGLVVANVMYEGDSYTRVSDTEFTVSYEDGGEIATDTYTRNTQIDDLHIWG